MIIPLLKQLVTKRDHPLEDVAEMFTYSVVTSHAATVLDAYDFNKWIDLCIYFGYRDVYDILDQLRFLFDGEELGDALDELTADEFMDYVSSRYSIVFEEHVTYTVRRIMFKKE